MIGSIILSILAVSCYMASHYGADMPDWSRSFFAVLSWIFIAYALVPMVERGLDFLADFYKKMAKASNITQISLMMENARGLNQSQIDMLLRSPFFLRHRLSITNVGKLDAYQMGNAWIDHEFIVDFLNHCTEETLYPVNNYSDSKMRDDANALVKFLCDNGLAVYGSGPNRATWIEGLSTVKEYFGVE
jgi:hypothetical protein